MLGVRSGGKVRVATGCAIAVIGSGRDRGLGGSEGIEAGLTMEGDGLGGGRWERFWGGGLTLGFSYDSHQLRN